MDICFPYFWNVRLVYWGLNPLQQFYQLLIKNIVNNSENNILHKYHYCWSTGVSNRYSTTTLNRPNSYIQKKTLHIKTKTVSRWLLYVNLGACWLAWFMLHAPNLIFSDTQIMPKIPKKCKLKCTLQKSIYINRTYIMV